MTDLHCLASPYTPLRVRMDGSQSQPCKRSAAKQKLLLQPPWLTRFSCLRNSPGIVGLAQCRGTYDWERISASSGAAASVSRRRCQQAAGTRRHDYSVYCLILHVQASIFFPSIRLHTFSPACPWGWCCFGSFWACGSLGSSDKACSEERSGALLSSSCHPILREAARSAACAA